MFKKKQKAWNIIDLTGAKIHHWTILKITEKRNRRDPIWLCECECGNIKEVSGNSLRNGSKSCGCLRFALSGRKKFRTDTYDVSFQIYAGYRCAAKRRKFDFKLTFADFLKFLDKPCYYCGKTKTSKQKKRNGQYYRYNGIDRVNNEKGYELTNCVTCCKICNSRKRSVSPDMIIKIYNYLFKNE